MFDQVREDIRSVFHRDPAARNTLEVLLNYPGLHAVLFHRLAHGLWTRNFKQLARFRQPGKVAQLIPTHWPYNKYGSQLGGREREKVPQLGCFSPREKISQL